MSNGGFKAFVDASAGASGALFAAVFLYPLDFAKTKKQAQLKSDDTRRDSGSASSHTASSAQDNAETEERTKLRKKLCEAADNCWFSAIFRGSLMETCLDTIFEEGWQGLYVGLPPKALHTVLSNFAYFYWYSFLKSQFTARFGNMSTSANLLVASAAGALNMTVTLPFEVVTTRCQTSKNEEDTSMMHALKDLYSEGGVLRFWRGYIPSLILVSNPAINYTLFDRLKLKLQIGRSKSLGKPVNKIILTAMEAFVLGAIAKAVATIVTYPLIRTKVIMQAQKKQCTENNAQPDGLVATWNKIRKLDGVMGYYKGCSGQLIHTVLKSALLLMTKEQIATWTMFFLYSMKRKTPLSK